MNDRELEKEFGGALGLGAGGPAILWKLAACRIGRGEAIEADPWVSRESGWRAELGVVIGRSGRYNLAEHTGGHLASHPVVNDVTVRDLQRDHLQWFTGENVTQSMPVGPWVVTVDEVGYRPGPIATPDCERGEITG